MAIDIVVQKIVPIFFLHIFKIEHVGSTYALAAASSLAGKLSYPSFNSRFDSDSFKICVDTGASCSMSGDLNHFQDLLPVEHRVSGIGEQALQAKGKGTLVFKLEDDDGITSTIKLPGSLYVPGLPCPLLVPRHWSEQARDDKPLPDGTCAFFGNK